MCGPAVKHMRASEPYQALQARESLKHGVCLGLSTVVSRQECTSCTQHCAIHRSSFTYGGTNAGHQGNLGCP